MRGAVAFAILVWALCCAYQLACERPAANPPEWLRSHLSRESGWLESLE